MLRNIVLGLIAIYLVSCGATVSNSDKPTGIYLGGSTELHLIN